MRDVGGARGQAVPEESTLGFGQEKKMSLFALVKEEMVQKLTPRIGSSCQHAHWSARPYGMLSVWRSRNSSLPELNQHHHDADGSVTDFSGMTLTSARPRALFVISAQATARRGMFPCKWMGCFAKLCPGRSRHV